MVQYKMMIRYSRTLQSTMVKINLFIFFSVGFTGRVYSGTLHLSSGETRDTLIKTVVGKFHTHTPLIDT